MIKEQLNKVSSILQYLSFETVETMLYQMKSLNLAKFKLEFVMLTVFHAEQFSLSLEEMEVDNEVKESMKSLVNDFLGDLLQLADVDLRDSKNKELYQELMKKAAEFSQEQYQS